MADKYLSVVAKFDGNLGSLGGLCATAVTLLGVSLGPKCVPPRSSPRVRLLLGGAEDCVQGDEHYRNNHCREPHCDGLGALLLLYCFWSGDRSVNECPTPAEITFL